MIKRKILIMPNKCHLFSPNLVRHLFEKDALCPGTGQAAILDFQDQLRGPRRFVGQEKVYMETTELLNGANGCSKLGWCFMCPAVH